jgi:branched-subunit amino acid ABC-type transport system permease component
MFDWPQIFFNSIVTGSLYLIAAVGLTLTYGLSKFPNFAHAEFMVLGAYVGYIVSEQLGLGLPLAFFFSFLATGTVGLLCYRGIFQPLAKRGATIIHLMVASIALGFILRHSIGAAFDWSPRYFEAIGPAFDFGPFRMTPLWLWLIITAFTLAITLHFFMVKTKIGKAIRATASNPELALASGINVDRVILITWFIGAGLAAFAGIFRGADTQIWPMTGWDMILPVFAVTILGGIGNFYGAIAAAFIIASVENIGIVALTELGLSTSYRMAIPFLILIITLIVKPQGLAMFFRRA